MSPELGQGQAPRRVSQASEEAGLYPVGDCEQGWIFIKSTKDDSLIFGNHGKYIMERDETEILEAA